MYIEENAEKDYSKTKIYMPFLQKCLMGFFFNIILFICLFLAAWIFVAVRVFLQLWWAAAALCLRYSASGCGGLACFRAGALGRMASGFALTGL